MPNARDYYEHHESRQELGVTRCKPKPAVARPYSKPWEDNETQAEEDARYTEQCSWCGDKFNVEERGLQIGDFCYCSLNCAALAGERTAGLRNINEDGRQER